MTKAEKAHKAMLSERACVICERIHGQHPGGNVELHHLRSGGWGKGDWGANGIHTLGTKAWERQFGVSQRDLLDSVLEGLDTLQPQTLTRARILTATKQGQR